MLPRSEHRLIKNSPCNYWLSSFLRSSNSFDGNVTRALPVLCVCLMSAVQPVNAAVSGRVMAWGLNGDGQTTVPTGLSGVRAIAAGQYHTVALKSDSTVLAWGRSSEGQTNVPDGLSGVVAIAAGAYHTVALKDNGTVVAWGYNNYAQTAIPADLSGVTAIAAGGYHTVALQSDGTVVAWGYNYSGQATGTPTTNSPYTATANPVRLNGQTLSGVTAIAAGSGASHTVAVKSDGTVAAWGRNDYGQATVPVGLSGVTAIAVGGVHTVALKSDGTLVAWGDNYGGQATVPNGLTGVVGIAAGDSYSVALKADGTVVTWGYGGFGQTNVPAGLSGVTAIAAGSHHSVALVVGPTITTILAANSLTLVWPATSIGHRVESALSLSPPIFWSSEPTSLQINGTNISTVLPIAGQRKFYRLVKP